LSKTFWFMDTASTFFGQDEHVTSAIQQLSGASGASLGAVFTRPEVVEFILDLSGYTADLPLQHKRILEPSFGGGDFLFAIIRRLLSAWRARGRARAAQDELAQAIKAVELHRETFEATRTAVVALLQQEGLSRKTASALADRWLVQGDFLLTPIEGPFDFVVGNPPYVRQEMIPAVLLSAYRSRYATIYDRADLYIPFIERSLHLLAEGGTLGFICTNRWVKNRYGGPLRKLVAENFHLKIYVDMSGTAAFRANVTAYPAITVISRDKPGPTRVFYRPRLEPNELAGLARALRAPRLPQDSGVQELAQVGRGTAPWLLEALHRVALLRRLEARFPTIEEVGCKVGIGVATGADKAFIGDYESLEVEPERKLPLVTTQDILDGEVRWQGKGLVNPFDEEGHLVDLRRYPRLQAYLEARRELIAGRYCARRSPAQWYRTIDRIIPSLARTPKLLIPDIKGEPQVAFEGGALYPHHNLYYITSKTWDLRALQAVLRSSVARLFVAAYSTRLRGGYLRFQAQYLRRIRIPPWSEVPQALRRELAEVAKRQDLEACNQAVFELYGLSLDEQIVFADLDAPL